MNESQATQAMPQNTNNNTFDYNQLYTNTAVPTAPVADEVNTTEVTPGIQETPIVLNEAPKQEQEVVTNVIPSFDPNALEGNQALSHDELISSLKSDTQQENAEFKKNLIFIAAFFGVIIFAIVVLFPMLASL